MKPLNIFWVGVGLLIVAGISDQFNFDDISRGLICASLFTMIAATGIAMAKDR